MAPRKTTKCSTQGCRKKATQGGLCAAHQPSEPLNTDAYPTDGVVKVTELEAAQFAAKDAEIRNALLSMRNLELEIDKAERAFADAAIRHKVEQERRRAQYDQLKNGIEVQKTSYTAFITDLAQKYKIDPQKMLIDPDTRVIRDLRKDT